MNEIQMFGTVLDSADNKTHVLTNARVHSTGMTNYSTKGSVRADLSFRTSCESDIDVAKQVLDEAGVVFPRPQQEGHLVNVQQE